ncbi:MAG TPA: amidohydrolase, partial [Anaerovoracaceae bacterium]|nr:amidohydrolase [Anaerovoracaceae bacterium]
MDVQNLKKQVALIAAKAIELRRELHRFPEPGNGETRTAKIIEKELANLRLKPEYLLETGLISTIFAGNGFDAKETVGLRADIDGLPIKETLNLPFVSLNEGYMHACGHDVHTAVLLGTAMVLAKNKHELRRNVRLIFQPAEETTGGAERMIAAGCLAEPDVTSIYGLHIMPELTA